MSKGRILRLLGCLLFGEGQLVRAGGPGRLARLFGLSPPRYVPHPYMLYTLNRSWRSTDGLTSHNALGFRGVEIEPAKPRGLRRIVCMGESTTYCTAVPDDKQTYPARLEAELSSRIADTRIEVVNAGIGGYTSAENVLRCLFDVLPLQPDLVVYYFTHNDAHPRRVAGLSRDYREYSRSWYEPYTSSALRSALRRRIALAGGDIGQIVRRDSDDPAIWSADNIATNPPVAFRGNMSAIVRLCVASGSRFLFVLPPYPKLGRLTGGEGNRDSVSPVTKAVWEHRNIATEIAAENGQGVCDLFGIMPYPADGEAFPSEFFVDRTHVNARGAAMKARIIADSIVEQRLLNGDAGP